MLCRWGAEWTPGDGHVPGISSPDLDAEGRVLGPHGVALSLKLSTFLATAVRSTIVLILGWEGHCRLG